jgi:hypothetical protein
MNLTCTVVISFGANAGTYTVTLTYTAGTTSTWTGCTALASGSSLALALACTPSVCTSFQSVEWSGAGCTGFVLGNVGFWCGPSPTCYLGSGPTMTLTSYSCSPLNIVLTLAAGETYTFTP